MGTYQTHSVPYQLRQPKLLPFPPLVKHYTEANPSSLSPILAAPCTGPTRPLPPPHYSHATLSADLVMGGIERNDTTRGNFIRCHPQHTGKCLSLYIATTNSSETKFPSALRGVVIATCYLLYTLSRQALFIMLWCQRYSLLKVNYFDSNNAGVGVVRQPWICVAHRNRKLYWTVNGARCLALDALLGMAHHFGLSNDEFMGLGLRVHHS